MGQKIGWKFGKSEEGDAEGLNDGGVETFKDDHLLSLAKESAQNSLDAREDRSKPVILEFNTFKIDMGDFPDIGNYRDILDMQIKYWKKTLHDTTAVDFFKKAKNLTDSKKMFCLRISDFNTTGLEGSRQGKDKPFSGWFKLVRSKGVTDNTSLKGGSFGLGKSAAFACSRLRTVFYNTKDLKGVESHQGVSILASYDTRDGERTRGKGYFCNLEDFSCLEGPLSFDPKFRRESPGTDIYIMGFVDNEEDLEDKLFSSILRSFLLAIYENNLTFILNGESINKKSLKGLIEKYRDENYNSLDLRETIEYYDILEKKLKSERYKFSMMEKDDVQLDISIGPGLSRRVGMFRNNGMKIFDKKGIRSFNDFVATLSLQGEKVNAYFRSLENPEHNDWRAERSDNPKEAKNTIKKLFTFISKNLKELEDNSLPESENIEGIELEDDEMFEEAGVKPLEGLEFTPLKVRKSKTSRKKKKNVRVPVPVDSPEPWNWTGPGPGPKPKPNPEEAIKPIYPKKIRIFQDKKGDFNLIFTLPEKSKSLNCNVFIGGEQENEIVEIETANIMRDGGISNLEVEGNEIKIGQVEKNISNHLNFKLNGKEKWALEVNLYEN
jgi:hypothetical protein